MVHYPARFGLTRESIRACTVKKRRIYEFNLVSAETLSGTKRSSSSDRAEHAICGDHLKGFLDLIASHTDTSSQSNAQPVGPGVQDPYVNINIQYDIQYGFTPPPAGATFIPVASPIKPFSPAYLDQAGDSETGNLVGSLAFARARFINTPRLFQNDAELFRVVGGFKGDISDDLRREMATGINR